MTANSGSLTGQDLDVRLLRFRSGAAEEEALVLARALFEVGRFGDAIEVCADPRSAAEDPTSAMILEGQAWAKDGDLLRAQSCFVRAARSAPKASRPFQCLAEVLLKRGDPDRALAAVKRALAFKSGDAALLALRERAERLVEVARLASVEVAASVAAEAKGMDGGRDDRSVDGAPPSPDLRSGMSAEQSPSHDAVLGAAGTGADTARLRTGTQGNLYAALSTGSANPGAAGSGPKSSEARQVPTAPPPRRSKRSLAMEATPEDRIRTSPMVSTKPHSPGGATGISARPGSDAQPATDSDPASSRFRDSISALRKAIAESSPMPSTQPPASTQGGTLSRAPKSAGPVSSTSVPSTSNPLSAAMSVAPKVRAVRAEATDDSKPEASAVSDAGATAIAETPHRALTSPKTSSGPTSHLLRGAPSPQARTGIDARLSFRARRSLAPRSRGTLQGTAPTASMSEGEPGHGGLPEEASTKASAAALRSKVPPAPSQDPSLLPRVRSQQPPREESSVAQDGSHRRPSRRASHRPMGLGSDGRKSRLHVEVHVPTLDSVAPPPDAPSQPASSMPVRDGQGTGGPNLSMQDTQLAAVPEAPVQDALRGAISPSPIDDEAPTKAARGSGGARPPASLPLVEASSAPAGVRSDEGSHAHAEDSLRDTLMGSDFAKPIFGEDGSPLAAKLALAAKRRKKRRLLVTSILVGSCLLIGGGIAFWMMRRHSRAATLQAAAEKSLLIGTHASLAKAEEDIERALQLHDADVLREVALRVKLQKTIEEGLGSTEALLDLLDGIEGEPRSTRLARAYLAARKGNIDKARKHLQRVAASSVVTRHESYLLYRLDRMLTSNPDGLAPAAARKMSPVGQVARIEEAFLRGDFVAAERHSLQVLRAHPKHVRARLWLDLVQAQKVRPSDKPAQDSVPNRRLKIRGPSDEVLRHLLACEGHLAQRHEDKARVQVQEALELAGTNARLLRIMAAWLFEKRAPGLAIVAARRSLSQSPYHVRARMILAAAYLRRRNGSRAIRVLGPVRAAAPQLTSLRAQASLLLGTQRTLLASLQSLESDITKAKSPWKERLDLLRVWVQAKVRDGKAAHPQKNLAKMLEDSDEPGSVELVARAALDLGHPALAEKALEVLEELRGTTADLLLLRARAARAVRHRDEARDLLSKALSRSPLHFGARRERAVLLRELGQLDGAKRELQRLVGLEGWDASSTELLALRAELMSTLLAQGLPKDARAILSNLPAKDRDLPEMRPIEARVLLAENKHAEAVEKLRTVAEAPNADAETLVLFADALAQSKSWSQASKQYERALRVDRKSLQARFGLAEVHLREEAPKKALVEIERARNSMKEALISPRDKALAYLLEGRAQLQRRKKYHSDAYVALSKATAIESAPAEAWYFLAESSENSAEARRAYKTYLEKAPDGRYAGRARREMER